MRINVFKSDYAEIETMRDLFRLEANCQIVCDSILRRGMADPYLFTIDGDRAGYGGVWNKYEIGRVMEFYITPAYRRYALPVFREFAVVSGATHVEAQTNLTMALSMLYSSSKNICVEKLLFEDWERTDLQCPGAIFRKSVSSDSFGLFENKDEPAGDWVIEFKGDVVAAGGFLCHYNPPYGDLYMEVAPNFRKRGFGSYLLQEVKRVCYQSGKKPSARCNVSNIASRQTLIKAGMLPCGRILVGELDAQLLDI